MTCAELPQTRLQPVGSKHNAPASWYDAESRLYVLPHAAQAPILATAVFGLYSVFSVLYGVFTFRDCPEEAEALRKVMFHASHRSQWT